MTRINSYPPSAAHMRQWPRSTLVQVMACRLFSTKPLPEPMLAFCLLDPYEQTSVKFESKYKNFLSWKCIWKCRLQNGGHFVQGEMRLILPLFCVVHLCYPGFTVSPSRQEVLYPQLTPQMPQYTMNSPHDKLPTGLRITLTRSNSKHKQEIK